MSMSLRDFFDRDCCGSLLARKRSYLAELRHSPALKQMLHTVRRARSLGRPNLSLDKDTIVLGHAQSDLTAIAHGLRTLVPWRIGPFRILGEFVDSEWQSPFKWKVIRKSLPALQGARVLDIGASSGYFSLRCALDEAAMVIGIDPTPRCYLQLLLVESLANQSNVRCFPLGIEDCTLFRGQLDIVLCMGVIYHRRDPIADLMRVKEALSLGGTILVESLGLPAKDDALLHPAGRYMKMRNAWGIPSGARLVRWLEEAGFRDCELTYSGPFAPNEQRRTKYAPYESWTDFLDPGDPSKTIEGHDTPIRIVATAKRAA